MTSGNRYRDFHTVHANVIIYTYILSYTLRACVIRNEYWLYAYDNNAESFGQKKIHHGACTITLASSSSFHDGLRAMAAPRTITADRVRTVTHNRGINHTDTLLPGALLLFVGGCNPRVLLRPSLTRVIYARAYRCVSEKPTGRVIKKNHVQLIYVTPVKAVSLRRVRNSDCKRARSSVHELENCREKYETYADAVLSLSKRNRFLFSIIAVRVIEKNTYGWNATSIENDISRIA